MVEIAACFMDKVEAAAADDDVASGIVAGEDEEEVEVEVEVELEPVEPLLEPRDDAGPVGWPMPEFCPLTIDGAVKESFLETLRKDAEQLLLGEAEAEQSPDSRPSSSKRQRAGTGSPSSRSPYRNMLQVFQQCKQDVACEEEEHTQHTDTGRDVSAFVFF